jgi:hypothetical protein
MLEKMSSPYGPCKALKPPYKIALSNKAHKVKTFFPTQLARALYGLCGLLDIHHISIYWREKQW